MTAPSYVKCAVVDCVKNAHWTAKGAGGLCSNHHYRLLRHGNPLGGRTAPGEPERFVNDFLEHPPKSNDCIIWPFARNSAGYGHRLTRCGHVLVHREVCTAIHGAPTAGKDWVAHSCGNGAAGCINPAHLRWATPSENSQDTVAHGRSQRGEAMHAAKLTEIAVRAIRARHASGENIPALAQEFAVSAANIRCVIRRKTWKHVA